MRKNIFKIITLILFIFLLKEFILMVYLDFKNKVEIESYYSNSSSFNYKSDMVIKVPSINLKSVVKLADNDFKNLDNGLVYYKYNDYKNKIIIFGHSGMGRGTYFNRLDELTINDTVYLYKDKLEITYTVDKIYDIKSTKIEVLNSTEKQKLLLITCKKNDKNKRLVVDLSVKSVKTLKK